MIKVKNRKNLITTINTSQRFQEIDQVIFNFYLIGTDII